MHSCPPLRNSRVSCQSDKQTECLPAHTVSLALLSSFSNTRPRPHGQHLVRDVPPLLTLHHCDTNSDFCWGKPIFQDDFETPSWEDRWSTSMTDYFPWLFSKTATLQFLKLSFWQFHLVQIIYINNAHFALLVGWCSATHSLFMFFCYLAMHVLVPPLQKAFQEKCPIVSFPFKGFWIELIPTNNSSRLFACWWMSSFHTLLPILTDNYIFSPLSDGWLLRK